MKDTLIFVAVMAGWVVLNLWVLPYFGIRTCMSGACRVPQVDQTAPPASITPAEASPKTDSSAEDALL